MKEDADVLAANVESVVESSLASSGADVVEGRKVEVPGVVVVEGRRRRGGRCCRGCRSPMAEDRMDSLCGV